MSEQRVHIFSSDPTLAPYLAHYLQTQSCTILEEEGKFYLCSSYFEKLPLLPTSAKRMQQSKGIGAVLDLMSPAFDTLSIPLKRETCIRAVLFVLNGIIKLKYKNCDGLMRSRSVTLEVIEPGTDYEVDSSGKRVYTPRKDVPIRAVIGAGHTFFRTADKQQPSMKKLWNIARSSGAVARAFSSYARSEDLVELRKVIEEIIKDTYRGKQKKTGKIPFKEWLNQRWTEPEIGISKMEEAYALLHNALMLGDQALHGMPFSDLVQANKFKASGTTMSLQEARDIIHTLLMKWVTSKS